MTGKLLLKKSKALPQHSLITIYKSFVRSHLDYGNALYDQSKMKEKKKKSIYYDNVIAIANAIKNTTQMKIYNELCFESLMVRRWLGILCFIKF